MGLSNKKSHTVSTSHSGSFTHNPAESPKTPGIVSSFFGVHNAHLLCGVHFYPHCPQISTLQFLLLCVTFIHISHELKYFVFPVRLVRAALFDKLTSSFTPRFPFTLCKDSVHYRISCGQRKR